MKTKSQAEYLVHIAFCEKMLQFCDRPTNAKNGTYFRKQIKTAKLAIKKATK